jgi:hypothetical protein
LATATTATTATTTTTTATTATTTATASADAAVAVAAAVVLMESAAAQAAVDLSIDIARLPPKDGQRADRDDCDQDQDEAVLDEPLAAGATMQQAGYGAKSGEERGRLGGMGARAGGWDGGWHDATPGDEKCTTQLRSC